MLLFGIAALLRNGEESVPPTDILLEADMLMFLALVFVPFDEDDVVRLCSILIGFAEDDEQAGDGLFGVILIIFVIDS